MLTTPEHNAEKTKAVFQHLIKGADTSQWMPLGVVRFAIHGVEEQRRNAIDGLV